MTIVAALQIGSDYRGKAATLEAALAFEILIRTPAAGLVVMPESLLGGYLKGEIFGSRLGCDRMTQRRAKRGPVAGSSLDHLRSDQVGG